MHTAPTIRPPMIRTTFATGLLGLVALGGAAPALDRAHAQDQPVLQDGDRSGLSDPAAIGTPKDEAGERVLEQMLPEAVGTPSQDERLAPAAGDLGQGFDADLSGPLGRSTEVPLGRAGSAGGGGAMVGESFGGGGVRVDGAPSGGGGVDLDRSRGAIEPGLGSSGAGGPLGN